VTEEWASLGRQVVADGLLQRMREHLGLNRSSMAHLLQTTPTIYTGWETKPDTVLRPHTAARVGRFYHLAMLQLELLEADGIKLSLLIPLHHALNLLAVPQELMMKLYREHKFEAEDLGILGLWLYEEDLEEIRGLL
jgi:hypothetical protein